MHLRRTGVLAVTGIMLGVIGATPSGCASDMRIGTFTDAGAQVLVPTDASDEPDVVTYARQCPSTECPAGRVTCPNEPFPCSVDLSSDDENCGACGVRCANDEQFEVRFNGITRCVAGACQLVCSPRFDDCNKLPEDGCETNLYTDDVDNCGACGNVCADICVSGSCGCPVGTLCPDQQCHDLETETNNCGACGNACPFTANPYPPAWHLIFACAGGQCNVPSCSPRFLDCNDDFLEPDGDGCETPVSDLNNCGACGHTCAPGEDCLGGRCMCRCGAACDTRLNEDPRNCGSCGFECPGLVSEALTDLGLDPAHGKPTCEQGLCGYTCTPNWESCDGDIDNGCETNLLSDPLNCGACGVHCDQTVGQPCVGGQCLTKDCGEIQ